MTDDIVTRLRILNHHAKKLAENESLSDLHRDAFMRCEDLTWLAADEIERLRKERETYRTRYLKCLASTVWKPSTHWKTYRNPQREDGLFVATVGDLVRSYQAIPDGALSIRCGLPHDEAEKVVEILNAWTASDAAWEKTNDRQ